MYLKTQKQATFSEPPYPLLSSMGDTATLYGSIDVDVGLCFSMVSICPRSEPRLVLIRRIASRHTEPGMASGAKTSGSSNLHLICILAVAQALSRDTDDLKVIQASAQASVMLFGSPAPTAEPPPPRALPSNISPSCKTRKSHHSDILHRPCIAGGSWPWEPWDLRLTLNTTNFYVALPATVYISHAHTNSPPPWLHYLFAQAP